MGRFILGFSLLLSTSPLFAESKVDRLADDIKANHFYRLGTANDEVVLGAIDNLGFRSEVSQPGKLIVSFFRPNDTITVDLDLDAQQAKINYPEGTELTDKDRELFNALAVLIEHDLGKTSSVADNLVRQASMFGAHPTAALQIREVSGFQFLSWQTLCAGRVNSSRMFEWDVGNTVHRPILPYGPLQYECAARCGPGCYNVGTSAWTQDCGNHDYCEEYSSTSDCMDEFSAASDDFSFAPNCSY